MTEQETVLSLLQQSSRLSWQINNSYLANHELVKRRNELLQRAESLARKTAKMPDYTPVLPNNTLVYRDLMHEHNTRYLIARNAVLRLKMDRWTKK